MHDDDYETEHRRSGPSQPPGIPDEMARRLAFLSDQLEHALELSRNLQEQHAAAQQTIGSLESKVNTLEEMVRAAQATQVAEGSKVVEEIETREKAQKETMASMFEEFRKTIEDRWDSVKNDWEAERERSQGARGELENRLKGIEDNLTNGSNASSRLESGLAAVAGQLASIKAMGFMHSNNKHTNGLVTPPSPRSISDADSDSDRPLKSSILVTASKPKKRSRGRSGKASRSRSPATSTSATLVDGMSASGTESGVASVHSRRSSTDSPTHSRRLEDPEATPLGFAMSKFVAGTGFPTPESSIHMDANQSGPRAQQEVCATGPSLISAYTYLYSPLIRNIYQPFRRIWGSSC